MTQGADPFLRGDQPVVAPYRLAQDRLAASLEEAYLALAAAQRRSPERWGAWKLGGTNHGSRRTFGVVQGYYGALAADEILVRPASAPGRALPECKGEVEVALRLDATLTGFDAWCVALEMPASAILNLVDLGVIALVSDRCAAGVLVLGAARPGPLPDLSGTRFVQRINGAVAADADTEALVDRPEALLAEFLELARRHGAPLRPGQWVATGGITPCLPYAEGDRVEVLCGGAVELDLTIRTA